MEFKLNKIDSDIREKIEESRNTDKIHEANEEHGVRRLKSDEHKKNKYDSKKRKNKNIITINAVKHSNVFVQVEAEKKEMISEEDFKGKTLDAKK